MTMTDLVKASQGGTLFWLLDADDYGGKAVVPHLFATKDGIAFVDGGWTEPEPAGHVVHRLDGAFVRGDAAGGVIRKSASGKLATLVPAFPSDPAHGIYRRHLQRTGRTLEQDRAEAKATLERSLGLRL